MESIGRILRGQKQEHFETLVENPDERRVVFFLPHSELEKIGGLNDYDKLIAVGWSKEAIERYKNSGYEFKLLTFPSNSEIAKLATWDNVIEVVCEAYQEFRKDIITHAEELKAKSYSEIVELAGYDFKNIKKDDSRYTTPENYAASDRGLVNTRAFLFHALNLNQLFSGDGYTRDEEGNIGLQELIGVNHKISEIPGASLVDLEVKIPTEGEEMSEFNKLR